MSIHDPLSLGVGIVDYIKPDGFVCTFEPDNSPPFTDKFHRLELQLEKDWLARPLDTEPEKTAA